MIGGKVMHRGLAFLLALSLLATPVPASAGKKKPRHADLENIGQRDINKGSWNLYSPEREVSLGEQLARNAERSLRLVHDPMVVEYVAEVAARVARHSDLRVPLRVRIFDSDEINAFALPGGFFFVSTGLIRESHSEAELASVIAHEAAHVAARHATKQMTKAQVWNWVSFPLVFAGGPVAYGVLQGLSFAVPLTFLKFSRNAEREADFLGQQYHYASGYDPAAFLDFFERVKHMEKKERAGIARAFSTHPMTQERIAAAERTIELFLPPREEYVVTTSQHDQVRAYLEQLSGARQRGEASSGPVLRRRNTEETWPRRRKNPSPF